MGRLFTAGVSDHRIRSAGIQNPPHRRLHPVIHTDSMRQVLVSPWRQVDDEFRAANAVPRLCRPEE